MIDYYAELNIDSSLGVDEINKELSKLENTWKRRELTSPEKATKMLALIIDAREAFKSTAVKSRYDRELAESKQQSKPVDPNQQRKDDIQKWRTDADTYYDRGEYDLAKIAVDRALALVTDSSDDDLYSLAASVYMEVGEYNAALSFINNAIVSDPQNGLHYLVKAGIYGRSASTIKFNDRYKASQYYEEERKVLQIGLNVANSNNDTYAKARLMGALAFSLYFEANPDKEKAEVLAKEALSLGDSLGNAQKVMDAIDAQHRAEEQAAREKKEAEEKVLKEQQQREEEAALQRERERKEGVYKEALRISASTSVSEKQRAISQLETIIDYKDSRLRIESIKEAIQYQQDQETAIQKRRQQIKKIACGAVAVLIVFVAFRIIVNKIIIPGQKYSQAQELLDKGEYESAISILRSLNGYKDSSYYISVAYEKINDGKYDEAQTLFANGNYAEAIVIYQSLGNFKDSERKLNEIYEIEYHVGNSLYEEGNLEDAEDIFETLDGYKDASEKLKYIKAERLYADGHVAAAAIGFTQIGSADAKQRGNELWNMVIESRRKSVVVNKDQDSGSYVFGITTNGSVLVVLSGSSRFGECNVSDWTNIVQIAASAWHTAGLKSDGTVVAVGWNNNGQCNVSGWSNIVQLAVAPECTAGLKADGTVVLTDNKWDEETAFWKDIVELSISDSHVLGLKADGTVVAAGSGSSDFCDVGEWQDIISVNAGYKASMGLRADGTVVVVGDNYGFNYDGDAIRNTWNNICACETKVNFVGLQSNGRMIQVCDRDNDFYHPGLSEWSDIVYFSKGLHVIAGVKSDGTIIVSGTNKKAFTGDVSSLTNIRPVQIVY